ncbi:MAG: hypothetical protein WD226_10455 [Planctomycetota bacterium]
MKTHLPAALVLLVGACSMPGASNEPFFGSSYIGGLVPAAMPVEGAVKGTLTFLRPRSLPGGDVWITPCFHARGASMFRDSDPFREGGRAARGETDGRGGESAVLVDQSVRWHDALFVDRDAGDRWLLLERRAFVSRWWVLLQRLPDDRDGTRDVARAMVFAVTLDDTDGDGDLTDRDAAVALMTDGDGRGAHIVTPHGEQLHAVNIDGSGPTLIFTTRVDRDGDAKFEADEPLRHATLELDGVAAVASPWIEPEDTERLERLYR